MKKKKDWITVFIKDNHFKLILYILFAFIPMAFLMTLIHEGGHMIIALCFGWKIISFQLSYFPLTYHIHSGLTNININSDASKSELIIIYCAGSLHSLIWGYIFFFLYYKYKLPKSIEIAFFTYSISLMIEAIGYIIIDLLYLKRGDWYIVYSLNPYIVIFLFSLTIINVLLFLIFGKKIIKKLDINDS